MRFLLCILLALNISLQHGVAMTRKPAITEVKERHAGRLLSLPGVVSVGIGKNPDGAAVIIVGLDKPRPDTEQQIPKALDGHPVRMEIIGPVRSQ